jgi:dUTP pyrophosphatase
LGSVPTRMPASRGSGAVSGCAGGRGGCDTCAATSRTCADTAVSAIATARYAAGMRLRIRRLDSTIPLPAYGTAEAAGFDLAAAHDLVVAPRTIALVRTGLVIEVPSGHFLAILARSSTPLKRGLMVANGVGVIDPDYSGPTDEILIQVINVTELDVEIRRGDRLAQGIVLPAPRVTWQEAAEIRGEARGGFGSTG